MAAILTPDLCVIGAGAGGLAVATIARRFGASVVLVERDHIGGRSLYAGGAPSRALVAAGHHAQTMRTGAPFGIAAEEPRINFRKTHDHVQQVIAGIAPRHAAAYLETLGVEVVKGEARFLDPSTLAIGEMRVQARRFVIATGSHPVLPPIPGLDATPYFTTDTILGNPRKLTHLLIVGAGAIGLELAQAYTRLGTKVTIVDGGSPMVGADPELAEIALTRLREEGVDIRIGTAVTLIQARTQGIGVTVRSEANEEMLDVSHILAAAGRAPDIDSLDLEKAGIRRTGQDPRRLELTGDLKTSNRRVYAIGDAAGGLALTRLAEHQAGLVVRNALFGLPIGGSKDLLPLVIYTDPEIAEIGLTEASARLKYKDNFRVLRASFADNDRARATLQTFGVAKLIVDRQGRILGAGIVGPGAGELIALFAMAVDNRLSVRRLGAFAAAQPTLSEIAGQLAREFDRGRMPNPLLRGLMALVRLLP